MTIIMLNFIILLFFNYGHFFSLLISFEGIMLSMFYFFSFSTCEFSVSISAVLMILSLMVMEGTVGLAVLIKSVSSFGRDSVFVLSSK